MAEGEACLLDSNIPLRISKSDDPQHHTNSPGTRRGLFPHDLDGAVVYFLTFMTKASAPPPYFGCNPFTTGTEGRPVQPVTYALPAPSTAMP